MLNNRTGELLYLKNKYYMLGVQEKINKRKNIFLRFLKFWLLFLHKFKVKLFKKSECTLKIQFSCVPSCIVCDGIRMVNGVYKIGWHILILSTIETDISCDITLSPPLSLSLSFKARSKTLFYFYRFNFSLLLIYLQLSASQNNVSLGFLNIIIMLWLSIKKLIV